MTLADALAIFRETSPKTVEELSRRSHKDSHSRHLGESLSQVEILTGAATKIATQRPVDAEALRLLIPLAIEFFRRGTGFGVDIQPVLVEAFRLSPEVRREHFLSSVKKKRENIRYWTWNALTTEDLPWLEGQLPELAVDAPSVWSQFTILAHSNGISDDLKVRYREIVHEHAPEALEGFDENRKREAQWRREQEEEIKSRKRRQRTLQEINEDILSSVDDSFQQRLWSLSSVNFLDPSYRSLNLIGEWADMPKELQQSVLDLCQEALNRCEPTPIPEGRSFSGKILLEAHAFLALLRERFDLLKLTVVMITKWLPAVLTSIPGAAKYDALAECSKVDRTATGKVLFAAVEREIRQENHYSVLLQDIPQELWTQELTEWVAEAVQNKQVADEARSAFLNLLAKRVPDKAVTLAQTIIGEIDLETFFRDQAESDSRSEENIRIRAIDILLIFVPNKAWPLIQKGFEILGRNLLVRLESLVRDNRLGVAADLKLWPSEQLMDLEEMLFQVFPPEEDPDLTGAFTVTRDHLLRELRYRIFELLLDRKDPETQAQLEVLGEKFQRLGEWYRWHTSDRKASSLIEDIQISQAETASSDYLPAYRVVRALIEAEYRIIRNSQDLLEAVAEELYLIAEDVSEDLAMLYLPNEIEDGSKRRHEEAIQLYIRRRLKERLPGKVLERECEITYRQRQDIKVIAPAVNSPESAEVIIEVKWSDNCDKESGVSTGLKGQLGQRYMRGTGCHQGVFLVGWNGKLGTWRDSTVESPECRSESLQEALEAQAEAFQEEYPDFNIRVVVLDLVWHTNQ